MEASFRWLGAAHCSCTFTFWSNALALALVRLQSVQKDREADRRYFRRTRQMKIAAKSDLGSEESFSALQFAQEWLSN